MLDQVYEYEQVGSQGKDWKELDEHRQWSVHYRKQMFSPWQEGTENIELDFHQLMDGMERGMYHSEDKTMLAMNLAIRYGIALIADRACKRRAGSDSRGMPGSAMWC